MPLEITFLEGISLFLHYLGLPYRRRTKFATAGRLQCAGDHHAGGNGLPPADCKPPGVTQNSAGALPNPPGVIFTAGALQCARGILSYHRHTGKQPYAPAVCILGFRKN